MPSQGHPTAVSPTLRERIAQAICLLAFGVCAVSPLSQVYLWMLSFHYGRSLGELNYAHGGIGNFMLASVLAPVAAFLIAIVSFFFASCARSRRVLLFSLACLVSGVFVLIPLLSHHH